MSVPSEVRFSRGFFKTIIILMSCMSSQIRLKESLILIGMAFKSGTILDLSKIFKGMKFSFNSFSLHSFSHFLNLMSPPFRKEGGTDDLHQFLGLVLQ